MQPLVAKKEVVTIRKKTPNEEREADYIPCESFDAEQQNLVKVTNYLSLRRRISILFLF
jgi:hypothetical protein